MKRIILPLLAATIALAGSHADSVCARAEYLLFNRHLNRTWLDSSYALLRDLHRAEPRHEYCLYLWSRIHLQKGDDAQSKAAKLELYGRAKAIAETLIKTNESNAHGHCWWGAAQGRIGQTRGVLNSLFMVPGLKKAFGRALELNPRHATALDAMGVLYYELPSFAGGNLGTSESYFKRGIESDPDYAVIHLDLAKVYIKQKRWILARAELSRVLSTTNPTYPADAELDDKPEARDLLARIKDK
jgi:hypothetical protein